MKILAIEHVRGALDPAETPELLRSEARTLWELTQAGVVRASYFRADRREAVLELESEDLSQAAAALESLPLVARGVIAFELVPLVPYDGYARLFAEVVR